MKNALRLALSVALLILPTIFGTSASGQDSKYRIAYSVSNLDELNLGECDGRVVLDLSDSVLPERIRLISESYRVFPSLRGEDGLRSMMVGYEQFRAPRIKPGASKSVSITGRGNRPAAVGHYVLVLKADTDQLPNVDPDAVAACAGMKETERIFYGNVSRALREGRKEWAESMRTIDELQTLFRQTRPGEPTGASASMLELISDLEKNGIAPAGQDEATDDGSKTEDTPEEKTDPVDENDSNDQGDDDGEGEAAPDAPEFQYETLAGVAKISAIATSAKSGVEYRTLPDLAECELHTAVNMILSLTQPGTGIGKSERYCAVQRLFMVRTALVNMQYYLNESREFFESQYAGLETKFDAARLQSLARERENVLVEAEAMWDEVRRSSFTGPRYQSIMADLTVGRLNPEAMYQTEADCMLFMRELLKNDFTGKMDGYFRALRDWHAEWQRCLEEQTGSEKAGRAHKELRAAESALQTLLKARGVLGESILEEGEVLEEMPGFTK